MEGEEEVTQATARHVLTRRSAFGLAGAMCVGTVLGEVPAPLVDPRNAILRAIKGELHQAQTAFMREMQRVYASQYVFREADFFGTPGPLVATWIPTEEADG